MALAKAGADVHCKANDGYDFSRLHPLVVIVAQCRGGRSVLMGAGLLEWPLGCAGGRRFTMRC
jgi:hypothetical protein